MYNDVNCILTSISIGDLRSKTSELRARIDAACNQVIVCLSVCHSIGQSVCMALISCFSACLFVFLSELFCPSICLSLCSLSGIGRSILSVCLYVCLLSRCLNIYFFYLSICYQFIYLSIYLCQAVTEIKASWSGTNQALSSRVKELTDTQVGKQ